MFCTYAHYTPEGRLFYIGKGQGRRAYEFSNRGKHWKNVTAKYGKPEVQILANWDTEQEALDHEILLIDCFKELGHKLCNKTAGGEGISGYRHTEAAKLKIAAASKGNKWNLGVPMREETKQKIRLANTGKKMPQEAVEKSRNAKIGKKHSEETKAKLRQAHAVSKRMYGNKYRVGSTTSRKWIWIGENIATGNIIMFNGGKELVDAGFSSSHVASCISGVRKSHKGYTWSKKEWSK